MNPGSGTRLYQPSPVRVAVGCGQRPRTVAGKAVEAVREEWVVEDRWWTRSPVRRHYFELALSDGRCLVVYRDLVGKGWWSQRT